MRMLTLAALSVAALCFFGASRSFADDAARTACICGPGCSCSPGVCPGGCPLFVLQFAAADPASKFAAPCPNGKCPAGAGPKAANSAGGCGSAPATVKGRAGFHPVRNAIRAIRGR